MNNRSYLSFHLNEGELWLAVHAVTNSLIRVYDAWRSIEGLLGPNSRILNVTIFHLFSMMLRMDARKGSTLKCFLMKKNTTNHILLYSFSGCKKTLNTNDGHASKVQLTQDRSWLIQKNLITLQRVFYKRTNIMALSVLVNSSNTVQRY